MSLEGLTEDHLMPICLCGCDEDNVSGNFKPGHDQKLRADLERRVGGLFNLARLVYESEEFAAGRSSTGQLAKVVRATFEEKQIPAK